MTYENPSVAFLYFPRHISSAVVQVARSTGTKAIFDLTFSEPADALPSLLKAGPSPDAVELKLPAAFLTDRRIKGFLDQTGITTVWTELHEWMETERILEAISKLSDRFQVIPITGSLRLIAEIIEKHRFIDRLALKGNEASGFVGNESLFTLYSIARQMARETGPSLAVWGGIGLPRAAAAFFATNAWRIVFESVHWLSDLFTAPETFTKKISRLRPEHTEILGLNLDVPCRVFNKGNSRVVREMKDFGGALCGIETSRERRLEFHHQLESRFSPVLSSTFGPGELVPVGVEASFATPFVQKYGSSTQTAISAFIEEIEKHLRRAPEVQGAFLNSSAARELGTRYPFIQGAMTWISDNPQFARRIAEAGALPTLALGMMDEARLENALGDLPSVMGNFPYGVNVITLDENPFRETQLAWIKRHKPPFAVIAAGDPSYAADLMSAGIETFYIVSDRELLRMALQRGIRYLILEGNEAGGHVGQFTTLMWAQTMLLMKQGEPELFEGRRMVLAGGICNRETAFMAAMLGAEAIQMGTAYLTVSDILETHALTPVYQKLVLESGPRATVITGESIGLRVRSLRTPVVESVCRLERNLLAQRDGEASIRQEIETVCAGSLMIASRGEDPRTGSPIEERECVERGQFMSGAAAGAISTVKSARDLHEELAKGELAAGLPFTGPLVERPARAPRPRARISPGPGGGSSGGPERIAITGMSCVNSLGKDPESVWAAVLAMKSGITPVPLDRWNHEQFFDPRPGTTEKTYCRFGAFQDLEVTRADLMMPPQDFRSMANSTKATLWLASKAIRESGILQSTIARERIAVIVSQNSGEAASTLGDAIIRVSTANIIESIKRVASLSPEQQAGIEESIKEGRIAIDDTTLLGRLNCTAAGFICNRYGLAGPSFSVSAACATSLVALYCAYNMIRNGLVDAAVIGGAEELLTPMHFLEFSALGALAGFSRRNIEPSEAGRPFDRDRDGMVLGEGGAMIVVEREGVALARGAKVLANITSMGACNSPRGMVESCRLSQEMAVKVSLKELEYGPECIDLVECHATGTIQGDIEEVQALKSIFRSKGKTVLTSFKSQIGHTLGASGLSSLIRGVMAMNAGIFPPTINFQRPDPRMELEGSGLRICPRPEKWSPNSGGPRRMQVNAFGFGGSNYVVQLEESHNRAPVFVPLETKGEDRPTRAELPGGLSFFRAKIGGRFYRLAVEDESNAEPVRLLENLFPPASAVEPTKKTLKALARRGVHIDVEGPPRKMAFVFPGQGAHYAGMGYELYRAFPVIREWMDRAAELADFDLLKCMFHGEEKDIRQQPALFSIEYAIARMLMSLGLRPAALAGHSLGELTALCLAGVYSFEDGFRIVSKRAACMEKASSLSMDPGKMLAVDAPMEVIRTLLAKRKNCCIANMNSPSQTVIGGNGEELTALRADLGSMGYRGTLLPVSMAFHSPVMRCIRDEMDDFTKSMDFHAPEIPVVSNTTAMPFPDDPLEIRRIIMAHLESPVLWMEDVKVLWNDFGIRLFVEAGPKAVVSDLIADSIEEAECAPTCLQAAEIRTLRAALAKIYVSGNFPAETPVTNMEFPGMPGTAVRLREEDERSEPAQKEKAHLKDLIQRQISSFIIDSFGKFLKPAILSAIQAECDPSFSFEDLENTLKDMFPDPGRPHQGELPPSSPPPAGLKAPVKTAGETLESVTEAVIRVIMETTGYDLDEIEPAMDLRKDLSIRSSRLPVLIHSLESRFAIGIDFQDFRDVRTIADVSRKISEIMAGNEPGKTPQRDIPDRRRATEIPPVKRIVFKNLELEEETALRPVEVTPMDSVVILSALGGSELGRQAGALLLRDYGCDVHRMAFLENNDEPANGVFDLRKRNAGVFAADALGKMESPAGLVILLDSTAEALLESVDDATRVLEGFFPLLKTFLASSARRFLILVDIQQGPDGASSLLREGLIGAFLAAAHESPGVLFRSVRADGAAPMAKVLRGALNTAIKPMEIAFESKRPQNVPTRIGKAEPSLFSEKTRLQLGPDDVILLTGGCSGLMPYLGEALLPFGCKVVFVGRTTPGARAEENPKTRDIRRVLDKLRAGGIAAEYFPADVTDPAAMGSVARQVEEKLGKITGIIHGAGILSDNLLENMSSEDFSAVLKPKIQGAWTLFNLGMESLRFFACLSSAACILGNPGQVNYCCANRAMSALVSHFSNTHGGNIVFKSIMLPPLEGAGMAENPELKSIMESMGIAYVPVEQISNLILRELHFADPADQWVMFMRSFPNVENVLLDLKPENDGALEWAGMNYPREFFPLIDSVTEQRNGYADLVAHRTLNRRRDLWVTDHKPFKFMRNPLVSAIMAVEMFMETARILHPGLEITGIGEARFMNAIECPEGKDRHIHLQGKTRSRKNGSLECDVFLSSRPTSGAEPNPDWSDTDCRAIVRMGTQSCTRPPLARFPVREDELDSRSMDHEEALRWYEDRSDLRDRYRVIDSLDGSGPGVIRGRTVYRAGADFKQPGPARYQYSPYLLEALLQIVSFYVVMNDETEKRSMIPLGFEEMSFERKCADGETLTLEARMRGRDEAGITWDSQASDPAGKVIMTLQGLRMGWLTGQASQCTPAN